MPSLMRAGERLRNLMRDRQRRRRAAADRGRCAGAQRFALDEFHDEVGQFALAADVVERADVGVIEL